MMLKWWSVISYPFWTFQFLWTSMSDLSLLLMKFKFDWLFLFESNAQPGPIPGMRPPMGAGSVHQANQKGSSMGLLMPMYTFGIVAFFVYTIMKVHWTLVFVLRRCCWFLNISINQIRCDEHFSWWWGKMKIMQLHIRHQLILVKHSKRKCFDVTIKYQT